MKLLLISIKSESSRGGIATWTSHFLSRSEKENICCDLVNTDLVGRRAQQEFSRRSLRDEYIRTFRIFRDLRNYLKQNQYDAVHLNTSCGTFGLFRDLLIARCIKKKGIKLVTHFHCDISFWIRNPFSHRWLGRLAVLSDECLVLCESSRQYLKDAFGASSKKMPNFLDDRLILETNKNISDTLSNVLFVGRVCKDKGVQEIYSLAARLPHLTFRLVGAVSDMVATWEKPDNIILVGPLSTAEVLAEMDGADLFLLPSHSEGFSLALTEAMARGLPSIATDVGAAADMLSDGCGAMVPVGDVDAMVDAIGVFANPEARREASRRSIARVREQYVTDVIVERLKRLYL